MMLNSNVLFIISVAMLLIVLGVDDVSASNHLSSETSVAIGKGMIAGDDILKSFPNPTQKEVTISTTPGSNSPGCETTLQRCFIPKEATIDVGGKVIFSNTDTAAHTFTSGTPADGPSGIFDSVLVLAGSSYEWTPTTVGEVPFFCMVHPWMTGLIIVGSGTNTPTDTDGDGIINLDDQCDTLPEVLNGYQDSDGCPDEVPPTDTDGDGIINLDDQCDTLPEVLNGYQDSDGCPDEVPPINTDGDGIIPIIIVVAFAVGIGAIIMIVKQKKKNEKSGETQTSPKDIESDYSFDDSKLK